MCGHKNEERGTDKDWEDANHGGGRCTADGRAQSSVMMAVARGMFFVIWMIVAAAAWYCSGMHWKQKRFVEPEGV